MKEYMVALAIIITGVLLTLLPDKRGGNKDDISKSTKMERDKQR